MIMRSFYAIIVFLSFTFQGIAQMKTDTAVEYRDKPEFSKLHHKCSANVYLTQGDTQMIRVEADSAIATRLRTDMVKESLVIWTQKNIEKAICLNAYITAKNLKLIEASGKGKLENSDTLKADTLTLVTKFFGGMKLNVECNHLVMDISGSMPVVISGKARTCEIKHTSTPLLDASQLETEKCSISITQSGVVKIRVKNEIVARISGTGGIYYLGNPGIVDREITGNGYMINLEPR